MSAYFRYCGYLLDSNSKMERTYVLREKKKKVEECPFHFSRPLNYSRKFENMAQAWLISDNSCWAWGIQTAWNPEE